MTKTVDEPTAEMVTALNTAIEAALSGRVSALTVVLVDTTGNVVKERFLTANMPILALHAGLLTAETQITGDTFNHYDRLDREKIKAERAKAPPKKPLLGPDGKVLS